MIALLCTKASLFDPVLHVAHSVPMSAFAGLMVPRQAHAAELSHDERALAWALLIESGHIPRVVFQDLYNVWALLQANRG